MHGRMGGRAHLLQRTADGALCVDHGSIARARVARGRWVAMAPLLSLLQPTVEHAATHNRHHRRGSQPTRGAEPRRGMEIGKAWHVCVCTDAREAG